MLRRKLGALLRQARQQAGFGVGERDVVERDAGAKGLVGAGVVHVVTWMRSYMMPKRHGRCLAFAGQVIGKTDARSEIEPGILHQTFRDSILAECRFHSSKLVAVEKSGSDWGRDRGCWEEWYFRPARVKPLRRIV